MDKENKESFIRRSSRYFAVTFSPLQSDDRRGEDCSDRGHRSEYTRGGGTQRRFTFNVNFKGKDRIHVDRFNVCPGFPLPLSVARGRNPRWQNGKDDAIFHHGLIRRDALGSPRFPHFCQLHHATARFVSPFVYTCSIDQTYSNFTDVFIYWIVRHVWIAKTCNCDVGSRNLRDFGAPSATG